MMINVKFDNADALVIAEVKLAVESLYLPYSGFFLAGHLGDPFTGHKAMPVLGL